LATFGQFGNLRVNPEVYARFASPALATLAESFGNLRTKLGKIANAVGNLCVKPEENCVSQRDADLVCPVNAK
jgi:hypothetical protein